MRKTLLPLLASLAFASLTASTDGAPLKVMSAPNLLRVETTENIFVECQDCTGGDIRVQITVMRHPTKTETLDSTSVTLTRQNNYQMFGQVKIPAAAFSKDPSVKQYVYLQAQFDDQLLEKVVLVSFQSGYIFIQTEKTVYTPDSSVHYRMFAVTPQMEPVERDPRTLYEASIATEIVTPDGIILPLDTVSLRSGIQYGSYRLPEIASPGQWKVVARFQNNPQQSYSADFEVKEDVPPSFEVKLKPQVPFFYVDSSNLTVKISATYLFGEAVHGTANVVFGVMQDGQKKGFAASLQRFPVQRGEGRAVLKSEHITQTFPNIQELVGDSIFVSVSVLTKLGGEIVEAEVRGIQIVSSPYTMSFKKTPRYFKPAMSFDITVEVLNHDETPAGNVPVVVFPGDIQGVTASNGIARLTVNTGNFQSLSIVARTNDPRLLPKMQAEAGMTTHSFTSNTTRFIQIGVDSADLQIGNNLKVHLYLNSLTNENRDITYLILSRGQLVNFGRFKTQGQVLIALNIPITKEMLPSFRIIAYYHADDEVVSDSVWVDVKDSCMGSLKLELERPAASYHPGRMLRLKVTGDPGATVGLAAVDKGVSVLNNKHRLTQKKVWDKVEEHDTGCTPGGGKDGMGVFYDAGLLFVTKTASGTPHRLEPKCAEPQAARLKRASPLMEVPTALVDKYKSNKLQKDCCVDGMRETSPSYSCERRSEHIVDGPACVEAFLDCCRERAQRADHKEDRVKLARREEDDDRYMDSADIVTRRSFPESFLWTDVKLPPCPAGGPCGLTSIQKSVLLPYSITTWQLTGISLSPTHGICVGEPLEVIVRKEFFIDLSLPFSAVRGEPLEIQAILHNYTPDTITVRVDLMEEQHVCSAASKRGRYRQEVNVGPQTTTSVPFIIVPMRDGEVQIEVKAAVRDSILSDGIVKRLWVVPNGVLVKSSKIVTLDPKGGIQEEILNSQIPRNDNMIPNSPQSTHISVTGREDVSGLVENVISGKSMGALIYLPVGYGEENLSHMTRAVIATIYLDRTNQWETVGFQRRAEALQHIKTGYSRELTYRKRDGSFTVFPTRPSSSWLTAYAAKVFTMAHSLVIVQEEVICDAIKYLILNTQQPDGMFREVGTVSHAEMTGDVKGRDSDASMTAFKLIAMQESRALCAVTVFSLSFSINKAVSYLERRLNSLTNPYAVAMTSYALANEGKLNREVLYRFVSSDLSHWPVAKGHRYTLEATAYALLALVKTRAFEDARPVVTWFNQQLVSEGFGSTQMTVMVYQALSEYWISAEKPEYDLNVDILMPGKPKPYKFNVNRENHHLTRTLKSNGINQDVLVRATGSGAAIVKMVSVYYAPSQEKQSDCQRVNMSVKLIPEAQGVNFSHPERKARQPLLLCRGGEYTCAEGSCSTQKKGKISNDERSAKICEATLTSKTDFAYKVQLEETVADLSTDTYAMRILYVIKEGDTDNAPVDKLRPFLSHQHCRAALGLQKGKTYLIMGSSRDILRDDQAQTFQYVLDEKTWVEYWPTTEECQTDEHRLSCLGLEDMLLMSTLFD
ncbi:complement C3-like [Salarias fasciatus]|uniref:complement C3-like n=1 Tax=Salarias fasciatus TaxID=181472 RepID=UPI0011765723|nr:complement C3-like [Salarias fasciatus]